MSVPPYPVDDRQHLQIPEPDAPVQYSQYSQYSQHSQHSTHLTTPFVNPHFPHQQPAPENTPYPPQNTPYPPQTTPYPPENTPYPPQNTPYPPQQSLPTNPDNFRESVSNLQINEGLQDLGRNLLKQGKNWTFHLRVGNYITSHL